MAGRIPGVPSFITRAANSGLKNMGNTPSDKPLIQGVDSVEKKDIKCVTYVSSTEYAAIKSARELWGLSESAILRLGVLKLVDQQTRSQLLRDRGLADSDEPGGI